MPEIRDIASEVAREEIARFSQVALDYPWPHEHGVERPQDLLEWVKQERARRIQRRKMLGATIVALGSMVASVAVSTLWGKIVAFFFP